MNATKTISSFESTLTALLKAQQKLVLEHFSNLLIRREVGGTQRAAAEEKSSEDGARDDWQVSATDCG